MIYLIIYERLSSWYLFYFTIYGDDNKMQDGECWMKLEGLSAIDKGVVDNHVPTSVSLTVGVELFENAIV